MDNTTLYYFGTDDRSPGHFFWKCEGDSLIRNKIWFDDIPFNPEEMPMSKTLGSVEFYGYGKYCVLAICGSCSDRRGGCKSVFWVEDEVSQAKLREIILSTPIAKKIIDKMPFDIKW